MVNKTDEEVIKNFENSAGDENDYETAEYSPKSEFSKPEVVKSCVLNCANLRAKEMRKGYHNIVLTNDGIPIKTWISDERKQFIGSVIALKGVLKPEIDEDDSLKDLNKEIIEREQEIFNKYCYYPLKKVWRNSDRVGNKDAVWVKTGEEPYIPEPDEQLAVNDSKYPHSVRVSVQRGVWDSKVNRYWDEMVELYDELFEVFNTLIHKKNYFKQAVSF